jgi:hypothetical protein
MSSTVLHPVISSKVAIVIPIYRRPTLTERYSLRSLECLCSGVHDTILLQPIGLNYNRRGCISASIDGCHFLSRATYARLMILSDFYELFSLYEYIFIYQLDCLLFSPSLLSFCDLGQDYYASAWFHLHNGWPESPFVGLGGLSLRKVSSFIRVLGIIEDSPKHKQLADHIVDDYLAEDVFWGRDAPSIDPSFRVCTLHESLLFSFNGDPGKYTPFFPKHSALPPLGCHAWLSFRSFCFYNLYVRIPLLEKILSSLSIYLLLFIRDSARRLGRVFSR